MAASRVGSIRVGSWAVALLVAAAGAASAARIEYTAIDVEDTRPGEDRWRYEYVVRDFAFAADQGFTIHFDVATSRFLEIPAQALHPDWDVIAIQPDPDLPDDGFFDALAIAPIPTLDLVFQATFVWLGGPGSRPGAQRFEINQFDDRGAFLGALETGFTVVPEPGPGLLTGLGLLGLAGVRVRSAGRPAGKGVGER